MRSPTLKPLPNPARHLRPVRAQDVGISDDEVLEAWSSGAAGFGALLYDHLIGVIDGTLYRVLGERSSEHDDMVQVTFEQLLMTLANGKFRRECSLKSWAGAIASRVGLNAIRSRRTIRKYFAPESEDMNSAAAGQDVGKSCEARQLLEVARRELGHLSAERAEALMLHDVLGYSLAEVAAISGVTVAAAQSRVVRGRRELHDRLVDLGLVPGELS